MAILGAKIWKFGSFYFRWLLLFEVRSHFLHTCGIFWSVHTAPFWLQNFEILALFHFRDLATLRGTPKHGKRQKSSRGNPDSEPESASASPENRPFVRPALGRRPPSEIPPDFPLPRAESPSAPQPPGRDVRLSLSLPVPGAASSRGGVADFGRPPGPLRSGPPPFRVELSGDSTLTLNV